jgi:hypothetical protein
MQILRWVRGEFLLARGRAEVEQMSVVIEAILRCGGIHLHAAHGIGYGFPVRDGFIPMVIVPGRMGVSCRTGFGMMGTVLMTIRVGHGGLPRLWSGHTEKP